jgi:hypothetical protein
MTISMAKEEKRSVAQLSTLVSLAPLKRVRLLSGYQLDMTTITTITETTMESTWPMEERQVMLAMDPVGCKEVLECLKSHKSHMEYRHG